MLKRAIAATGVAGLSLLWIAVYPSPALVLLIGLVALATLNYFIGGRDVLYPAFTYTTIWALVAAAFLACPIDVDPIGWKTVAIFLAGGASFSIGSQIGNRPLIRNKGIKPRPLEINEDLNNPQARNALLGCTVAITLVFIVIILRSAGGLLSLGLQFFVALNAPDSPLSEAGSLSGTIIASGGLIPVVTLWVLLMEEKRRWKIVLCSLCAFLFPLLITQRGLVMGAFCGSVTLLLLKSRDRRIRKVGLPLSLAGLGIVTILALMSLTKWWTQGPNATTPATGAWSYITGPLAAFDYYVNHLAAYDDQPAAVFAQVLTPLSRLQLIHYRTSLQVDGSALDRFVHIPFPANVYTAYKPYYQDFGALGCFMAFGLFGFIEGLLFYHAIRGNRYAVFFLAALSGSLMFSTFDDHYHGFSRYLNLIIFAIGYFWLMKRIRIRL